MMQNAPGSAMGGDIDGDLIKKCSSRPVIRKRAQSIATTKLREKSPMVKKPLERRCQSLSPSADGSKRSLRNRLSLNPVNLTTTDALSSLLISERANELLSRDNVPEKDVTLPQCVVNKILRHLATKRREYAKLRKTVLMQQNNLLEQLAAVRELESRAAVPSDDSTQEVRLITLVGWQAHDLLMLVRDTNNNLEKADPFGPQVLQQLHAQLNPIPEEVLAMGAEIMARRIDLLNLFRGKHRTDRSMYLTNMEWKTKNGEFDQETEQLHRMVAGTAENLKAKLTFALDLAKIPWLDRDILIKKIERLQKENMAIHHKLEELSRKDDESSKDVPMDSKDQNLLTLTEELAKEKAAREALKEVVAAAESMLRVARARIATLERQLKESKADLEATKKKQKELEQLYRHRETSYDARSRKLLEVSKTGEITIETLSRQRDALELRVKELREQAEAAEQQAQTRYAEAKAHVETLQGQVAEQVQAQEKIKRSAEARIFELEAKVKELEDQYEALKERSVKLLDTERRRCLDYVPSKEAEPSDRETELWKELQVTRVALSKAEEELRQSRADKDSFLNSLSRIAQGDDADGFKNQMATELLEKERKIMNLQHIIEEQKDNEKLMEQSMTQYENQLASLRLEVKRLRNYDCYVKEVPFQEMQTEMIDLHMQVETLNRERAALVNAAASRALMLERHERAAELFATMTRAKRDIAAILDGRTEPPPIDDLAHAEVSRSLSSVCGHAADTWTALRAERARVLRLESAVLAQNLQLERESRVRTQLERRRTMLERELIRVQHCSPEAGPDRNPNIKLSYARIKEDTTTRHDIIY